MKPKDHNPFFLISLFLVQVIFLLSFSTVKGAVTNFNFDRISIDEGLSNRIIHDIFKDSEGFLWFCTENGINRYDGYKIRQYTTIEGDTCSLSYHKTRKVVEDCNGRLWIATHEGLNIYDRLHDNFLRPYQNKSLRNNYINDLFLDSKGNLWVLCYGQLFCAKSEELKKKNFSDIEFIQLKLLNQSINSIFETNDNKLWVINRGYVKELNMQNGLSLGDSIKIESKDASFYDSNVKVDKDGKVWMLTISTGIVTWEPQTNKWQHIKAGDNNEIQISTNLISDIYFEENGQIWIANNGGGIDIYNPYLHKTTTITANISNPKGLTTNSVLKIYVDDSGIMWFGTHNGGVCKYVPSKNKFGHYFHKGNENSLSNNNVTSFCEDKNGQIWIGTDGGGLSLFNPQTEEFKHYKAGKETGIKANTIVSLSCDLDGNIWIGSWQYGLSRFNPQTNQTVTFINDPKNPNSISSNNIYSLYTDSKGNLWAGTLESGLNLYDKKRNRFIRYRRTRDQNSLTDNIVFSIFEDSKERLWIGHNQGVDMIDLNKIDFEQEKPTIQFMHYQHPDKQRATVYGICEDSDGNIWIGNERSGIYILNNELEYIDHLTTNNGLSSNQIRSIALDEENNIWIASDNGLCKYTTSTKSFNHYKPDDGIQSMDFNRCNLHASNGMLYFGGINGFNAFNPKDIVENTKLYPTVITNFRIFDKSINVSDTINKRAILQQSITETKEIELSYRENFFTFEFTSLDFTSPEKNEYAYLMEGIDQKWNEIGNRHEANYTNLEPGKYLFKVRSTNSNGFWNEKETSIAIAITPPFWETAWMKAIYFLICIGIIYLAYYTIVHNEDLKNQVKIERLELQKAKEVSNMKINFFTNISHEFRTPLTLLIGPLESLINKSGNDAQTKKYLSLMYKNARQLNRLITQLLDFRNLEEGGLKNEPSIDDMMLLIHSVTDSFDFLARQRSIDFSLKCDLESLICKFDHDKLEKILLNLISNAFKYTPDEGVISVSVKRDPATQTISINVEDSGAGISEKSMKDLFSVFYRTKDQKAYMSESSGLGLSLTKSLVEVMSGKIEAKSTVGQGSIFTVTLPIVEENGVKEFVQPNDTTIENAQKNQPKISRPAPLKPDHFEYSILLVEDNPEVINFIESELNSLYTIYKASNGVEGLETALDKMPDLIISDIMMPKMNGQELCRHIKGEMATSHIPVILLTAKLSDEDQIEGFGAGADEYIPKPFNPSVLRARIANILDNRKRLRELFSSSNSFDITLVANNETDNSFLQKTMDIIKSNIANQSFDIELFASELNLSRSVFFKKIKTLTAKTPYQLVLDYRMNVASELLTKTDKSVSEIAFETGFNEPSNFSRAFTKYYGQSPKKYANIYKSA